MAQKRGPVSCWTRSWNGAGIGAGAGQMDHGCPRCFLRREKKSTPMKFMLAAGAYPWHPKTSHTCLISDHASVHWLLPWCGAT